MGKIQLFLNNFNKMTFEGKGSFWGICLALLLLLLTYIYSEKLRTALKEKSKLLFVVPVALLAGFVLIFINTCNYVPLSDRASQNASTYVWEQTTKKSDKSLLYTTDVKDAAGSAYDQSYNFSDILGQLTTKETSDHVAEEYTVVSSDDSTSITFYPDGTYLFRAADGGAEESGKYSYVDKLLTLTNDTDGAVTEVGKTSSKLRYTSAALNPAAGEAYKQEYIVKDLKKDMFVIEESIETVPETFVLTSADESSTITFENDGTYTFQAGDTKETGHYVYRGNELVMANAEGSGAFWKNFWLQFGWLIFAILVAVAMVLIFVFNARIKAFMGRHPLLWLLIPAALLIYFVYVAIGWNIWVSVSDWGQGEDRLNASYGWGGFGQYAKMFGDSSFWDAVLNTLKLFLIIPICLLLGMGLALIMDQGLKGTPVFRTLILLPFALSFVVTGLIWQQMFNGNKGILVEFFKLFGINENIIWTSNELVMYSIMIVMIWQFSGYVAVIFLAAIKNVPTNIINAAKLDGSYMPRIYRMMVIPQMKGAMGSCITILAMYALRSFDLIVSMVGYTNNAATTLPIMMYNEAFQKNNTAYAAAISCFLLAMVLVLILPLTYLTNRRKR